MKKTKLAQVYSKAIYNLGTEQSCLKNILKDFGNLLALLEKTPKIIFLFDAQFFSAKEQKQSLDILFQKSDFCLISKNALRLIIDKQRFFLIKDIIKALFILQDTDNKILKGNVSSALAFQQDEKKQLQAALVDQFKLGVSLKYKEDKSLAEGFVVNIAGHALDTSFNNKISNLNKHIKKNLNF